MHWAVFPPFPPTHPLPTPMSPDARPPAGEHGSPRLQKVLATAGYGSRRQCEELVQSGRVEIDRQAVTELGTRVDPRRQEIRVDGVVLHLPKLKYFMLHKPVDVVSTTRDPWARTRVLDLVDDPDRLFTVGRLDKSSSGLILVTNDGELANQLAHPRYRVHKTYRVTVAGKPTAQTLQQLRRGVYLAEGKAHVERIECKQSRAHRSVLEIVLTEGRNREIRRILARVGHKVQQLKRVAIGPLRLGELPVGAYRELSREELRALRQLVTSDLSGRAAATRRRPSRRRATTKPAHPQPAAAGPVAVPRTRRPPRGTGSSSTAPRGARKPGKSQPPARGRARRGDR